MNYHVSDGRSERLAAYAVRNAEHHGVVGLFVAANVNELADLVNQHSDPTTTEYLLLGAGGIHVVGASTARWGPAEPACPGHEFFEVGQDGGPLDGAVLDECWWRAVDGRTWHPLDWEPQTLVESHAVRPKRRESSGQASRSARSASWA